MLRWYAWSLGLAKEYRFRFFYPVMGFFFLKPFWTQERYRDRASEDFPNNVAAASFQENYYGRELLSLFISRDLDTILLKREVCWMNVKLKSMSKHHEITETLYSNHR